MQLTIITRGRKHEVDRMITELQGKYFDTEFTNKKTGKKIKRAVAMGVNPIQMWELVFPKEHLDSVIGGLFPNDPKYGVQHKIVGKALVPLRFATKSKPMPKWKQPEKRIPFHNENINTIAVGIREDLPTTVIIDGEEYTVEGL